MASLRSAYDPRHADTSVFAALLAARKEYGGKKIVIHDADDRKLSYDDIIRAAFALGSALKKGTRRKEAVGVMLPTGAGAIITLLRLQRLRPRAGDAELHGRRPQHPRRAEGGAR